jgi:hypothetical protein
MMLLLSLMIMLVDCGVAKIALLARICVGQSMAPLVQVTGRLVCK